MAMKDRKLQKRKERQEKLRKQRHLRHYGPALSDSQNDVCDETEMPDLNLPPATAVERMLRGASPSLLDGIRSLLPGGRRSADGPTKAQELAYDAMEAASPGKAAALAREALALDPDCGDALYVLALNSATSRPEQIRLLEQAVAAAERTLGGSRYFDENRGRFWGLLETRPYMRARAALADILRDEGRLGDAICHYEALLDLNPNDNQGIRDVLVGCYFLVDDLDGVRRLLERYEGDWSAIFHYTRVLERFLADDMEGAARARKDARGANPHVEAYLTGRKGLPGRLPDYYSPGQETEAIHCAVHLAGAWQRHARAVIWLKSIAK